MIRPFLLSSSYKVNTSWSFSMNLRYPISGNQDSAALCLHNAAESWLPEIGYRRFIEKLQEVFTLYEDERRKGRIMYYGMATWSCLRVKKGEVEHVNLDDVVDVAKGVGGEE